jgi:hypothetical protein
VAAIRAAIGGAAAWPLTVQAQQRALPVIGHLEAGDEAAMAPLIAAFRRGLGELGSTLPHQTDGTMVQGRGTRKFFFAPGRNVEILYRHAGTEL